MFYFLKTLVVIEVLMVIGLTLFRWALVRRLRNIVSTKVVTLALLTPVVALFCGSIYLFCVYLAAAVAFNSRSRAELASNYVFLLPLMPFLSVETGVGSVYLLAISAVFAMNLGALIGFAVSRGGRSLAQPGYDIGMLLLIGIFMFVYGRDGNATVILRGIAINVLGFGAPYLLISRAVGSREDAELILLRLMLGGVLTSVTACFQAIKHWVVFEAYYQALHVGFPITSATLALRGGMLRTGGSMVDYSAAGLFLACILALMPMLRSRFRPTAFWTVVAVIVVGLLATQSRGAWVGALAGLLFVFAYRGWWGRSAALVGTSVAAYLFIQIFANSGRLAAFAGKTEEASSTVSYRKQLFWRGMDQIEAHPLFGQKPTDLVSNLTDLTQGQHIVDFVNAHLYVAMAAGLPLFLVWCVVWLSPVVRSWKQRRAAGADFVEAPAAMIVPVLVAIAATSIVDRNLIWPTIALGLAGPCFALTLRHRPARAVEAGAINRLIDPPLAVLGAR